MNRYAIEQKFKSAAAFLIILILLPYIVSVFVNGTDLREVDGGVFATYEMAGRVAVELFNPRTWNNTSGRLAGVFFDAGTPGTEFRLSGGGYARYVGMDESEPGLWQGRFGSEGVLLPGLNIRTIAPV